MSEGIIRTRDEDARPVVIIPLQSGSKGACIIDKADFDFAVSLEMSLKLNRLPNGHIVAPESRSPSNWIYVARVITGAGVGQVVVYRDGDPSNLRRSNLIVIAGRAKKRDRDFLRMEPGEIEVCVDA